MRSETRIKSIRITHETNAYWDQYAKIKGANFDEMIQRWLKQELKMAGIKTDRETAIEISPRYVRKIRN